MSYGPHYLDSSHSGSADRQLSPAKILGIIAGLATVGTLLAWIQNVFQVKQLGFLNIHFITNNNPALFMIAALYLVNFCARAGHDQGAKAGRVIFLILGSIATAAALLAPLLAARISKLPAHLALYLTTPRLLIVAVVFLLASLLFAVRSR